MDDFGPPFRGSLSIGLSTRTALHLARMKQPVALEPQRDDIPALSDTFVNEVRGIAQKDCVPFDTPRSVVAEIHQRRTKVLPGTLIFSSDEGGSHPVRLLGCQGEHRMPASYPRSSCLESWVLCSRSQLQLGR